MSITPEVPAKTLSQMVATRIRVAMAVEDIRQSELARRMKKNEQWLSVRLRGRQPIDVNDLLLFARALNVSPLDLMPSRDEAAGASTNGCSAVLARPATPPPASGPFGQKPGGPTRPGSPERRRPMLIGPGRRAM